MGLLQYLNPFFADSRNSKDPGEIWWVPTPEVNEVPQILDVNRATPTDHEGIRFTLREIETGRDFDAENPKELPVASLRLEGSEELIVTKGKLRPCVVLAKLEGIDLTDLPEGTARRMAKHMRLPAFLVAPMFSVPVYPEAGTFMPPFIHRIRHMKYFHLFCLPEYDEPETPRSIVRLDRVFVSYLRRGCKPKGQRLDTGAFDLLRAMFVLSCGAVLPESMLQTIEGLKSMLDEDFARPTSA